MNDLKTTSWESLKMIANQCKAQADVIKSLIKERDKAADRIEALERVAEAARVWRAWMDWKPNSCEASLVEALAALDGGQDDEKGE